MRAADVMQKGLVTVSPELPVVRFEELLTLEEISGVPVVDGGGRVLGIASKSDIVRALADELRARPEEEFRLGADLLVGDIMSTDVLSVAPDEPVRSVAQRMIDGHVHRVLVIDGDEVVGIVTSLDLLRALL